MGSLKNPIFRWGVHEKPIYMGNCPKRWARTVCRFKRGISEKGWGGGGSAVSKAILKPVYRFGIPNSNPQTLKSVDFWCKISSTFLVAELRERCSELFRTQNNQKFPGFRPWTPLTKAYSDAPDSPAAQRFFSLLRSSENQHPPKNCWIQHWRFFWSGSWYCNAHCENS